MGKDTETQSGLVPNPHKVDIKWRDISGVGDPSPTTDHPAQGSNAQKINPHNFWL